MTEKEFENLKIGDKVWIYHGFLSEAFVVSKEVNFVEFKADSLPPTKFDYKFVGITKSQALEGEIELQEKYVELAEIERGQRQATLSSLKDELVKAKEEEESCWITDSGEVRKVRKSDYPCYIHYATEREAYEALAKFYLEKYYETMIKVGGNEMTKKRKMDNETAISFIQQAFGQYLSKVANKECKEAFAIAINALEREETCENKDCGTEMIFECSVCGASTIDRMNFENGEFNYCPNCGRKVEK